MSGQFYADLPPHPLTPSALLADQERFLPVPDDWHVVLTDIKGSTRKVALGLHEEINLVATGSIIAALNIAYADHLEIPFFFGGDGATLLLPISLHDPIMHALTEHRANTARNFDMELRVGSVPVSEVYRHGASIRIAKMRRNAAFSIPVVLGEGLALAESIIKAADFAAELPLSEESELNLEGMECRWDRVGPPGKTSEVVCLLVNARANEAAAATFRKVLEHIEAIYGPQQRRNPISVERLRLKATLGKIGTETRVKRGRPDRAYQVRTWLATLFGKLYIRLFRSGGAYLDALVQLTDTLVIDGRINTVISGTAEQRRALVRVLDQLETKGEITFGLHVSGESVMSCYVRNREDQHIHFVDGSDGGYTQAAKMLKGKLPSR